jgi:hypothetical protein
MAMVAQNPVVSIPKNKGGLYDAQRLVAEANENIAAAERDAERDKIDIKDHAQKARQHLVEANQELKAAYDALEAAAKKK